MKKEGTRSTEIFLNTRMVRKACQRSFLFLTILGERFLSLFCFLFCFFQSENFLSSTTREQQNYKITGPPSSKLLRDKSDRLPTL